VKSEVLSSSPTFGPTSGQQPFSGVVEPEHSGLHDLMEDHRQLVHRSSYDKYQRQEVPRTAVFPATQLAAIFAADEYHQDQAKHFQTHHASDRVCHPDLQPRAGSKQSLASSAGAVTNLSTAASCAAVSSSGSTAVGGPSSSSSLATTPALLSKAEVEHEPAGAGVLGEQEKWSPHTFDRHDLPAWAAPVGGDDLGEALQLPPAHPGEEDDDDDVDEDLARSTQQQQYENGEPGAGGTGSGPPAPGSSEPTEPSRSATWAELQGSGFWGPRRPVKPNGKAMPRVAPPSPDTLKRMQRDHSCVGLCPSGAGGSSSPYQAAACCCFGGSNCLTDDDLTACPSAADTLNDANEAGSTNSIWNPITPTPTGATPLLRPVGASEPAAFQPTPVHTPAAPAIFEQGDSSPGETGVGGVGSFEQSLPPPAPSLEAAALSPALSATSTSQVPGSLVVHPGDPAELVIDTQELLDLMEQDPGDFDLGESHGDAEAGAVHLEPIVAQAGPAAHLLTPQLHTTPGASPASITSAFSCFATVTPASDAAGEVPSQRGNNSLPLVLPPNATSFCPEPQGIASGPSGILMQAIDNACGAPGTVQELVREYQSREASPALQPQRDEVMDHVAAVGAGTASTSAASPLRPAYSGASATPQSATRTAPPMRPTAIAPSPVLQPTPGGYFVADATAKRLAMCGPPPKAKAKPVAGATGCRGAEQQQRQGNSG
ncbi:unnamed protein product, partial [Amoebophrya sp. A120]